MAAGRRDTTGPAAAPTTFLGTAVVIGSSAAAAIHVFQHRPAAAPCARRRRCRQGAGEARVPVQVVQTGRERWPQRQLLSGHGQGLQQGGATSACSFQGGNQLRRRAVCLQHRLCTVSGAAMHLAQHAAKDGKHSECAGLGGCHRPLAVWHHNARQRGVPPQGTAVSAAAGAASAAGRRWRCCSPPTPTAAAAVTTGTAAAAAAAPAAA